MVFYITRYYKSLVFIIFIIISSLPTNAYAFGMMGCDRFLDIRKDNLRKEEYKSLINGMRGSYVFGVAFGTQKYDLISRFEDSESPTPNQYLYLLESKCKESPTKSVGSVLMVIFTKELLDWLENNPEEKKLYFKK